MTTLQILSAAAISVGLHATPHNGDVKAYLMEGHTRQLGVLGYCDPKHCEAISNKLFTADAYKKVYWRWHATKTGGYFSAAVYCVSWAPTPEA